MSEIYILSDYGKLSKKDETIVFSQPDGTSTILFPFKTEHLVLVGKVSISADALRLLTKYKIGTTFLSSNGRFNGKLSFGDGKNIFLRQKQFRILDNPQKSLEIAKSIVAGKIRNEISFMQRIKRKNSNENEAVENAISSVKNTLSNAEKTDDIEKAKSYLEETWDISSIVHNHPVGANFILNLKESQSGFEIRFEHDKENTIYFYNN